MKKIKSYTGIWNVEKVLYAINDFNLPFPVTFTQIINVNIKMYIFDHLRMYIFAILPLDRYIFLSDKIFL